MFSEARAQLITVRDLLRFAVSRFNEAGLAFGHGSTNAYDEAAYLILHALHLPLDRLDPFLDARLLPRETEAVLDLLRRRVEERIPAAYLTREAWLGNNRFYVDERAIVPRSFVFELLEERLAPWIADPDSIRSVLDLCTGSGCLAILMAQAFPDARIDASDISRDALEVARRNVADYRLEERVNLVESDMFGRLAGKKYDLIVGNPPYVDADAMAALPAEYRREPRSALAGGRDGLDAIRVMLRDAPAHLTRDGMLVVEVGHNRATVENAFPALPFAWPETSGGDDRVFVIGRQQIAAAKNRLPQRKKMP
ncbi:MAG: 50S ribosomal protein L3 N(5)-glutamine methyltransferase [Betaproteobacteria bacterium]|nr:50S ribosomal protein L3 N(5)-glutamine methyltransferase [Betaproteobacteria bacterium]